VSLILTWLDYSADMKLVVKGDHGQGELDLHVSGNNSEQLDQSSGTWRFPNRNYTDWYLWKFGSMTGAISK
jgi:hypothetical protein